MTDTLDWNANTIAEFRANEGRLGGNFKGAPVVQPWPGCGSVN